MNRIILKISLKNLAVMMLCFAALLLASCAVDNARAYAADDLPPSASFLDVNLRAADALVPLLRGQVGSGGIIAASMVDMEDLDQSTPFGRMSMQQIGSRLSQRGFKVLEVRLGADLRVEKREGEFILTRETMRLLSQNYDASVVLLGVYSELADQVFMSVRVVRLSDSVVIAAHEYNMPRGGVYSSGRAGSGSIWSRYAYREQAFKR